MIRSASKSKTALVGFFCLPTSSKAHIHEPARGTAFKAGQFMYVLVASQSVDEGGYPERVVLSSDEPLVDDEGNELQADSPITTQHAQVRKNLPPRIIEAILTPDGEGGYSVEGTTAFVPKGMGLPHWEFISTNEDGSASQSAINAVSQRLADNKANAESLKEAVRNAKKSAKKSATSSDKAAE